MKKAILDAIKSGASSYLKATVKRAAAYLRNAPTGVHGPMGEPCASRYDESGNREEGIGEADGPSRDGRWLVG